MVVVTPAPIPLDLDVVKLYHTKDALIGNLPIVIFHGPSTTTNSTQNSSRIQAHVFSIAGYVSFPRLTVSPASPLYAAVHHLPEEKQGDEVCRGLAVSLLKYFAEMPRTVQKCLREMVAIGRPDERAPAMFDEMHAATLAANMVLVENSRDVASHISTALVEKNLSWTDVDVLLPRNSVSRTQSSDPLADLEEKLEFIDDGRPLLDYGIYKEIVELFGNPAFLPTSKLRRAPSRPNAANRTRTVDQDQKESLQRDMLETLETEKSYVSKVHELTRSIAVEYCKNATSRPYSSVPQSERAMQQLFPPSLSAILEVNSEFLNALRALMDDFEEGERGAVKSEIPWITERDPTGVESFARLILKFIPRFREPYQEYMRASPSHSRILNDFMRDSASNFAKALQQTGEQRLRSWLIEPTQRLPRYTLLIDSMVKQLPVTHIALSKLLKAKDMLADICALDDDGPADNKAILARLKNLISRWPADLLPAGRLITAVDALEVSAPYRVTQTTREGTACMLLLFPSHVVVLQKRLRESLSARGLLAELDRPISAPSMLHAHETQSAKEENLAFSFVVVLDETRFTESNHGHLLSLSNLHKAFLSRYNPDTSTNFTAITRSYCLLGAYEGKAARWNEEIARARIEHRFPEKARETGKWGLRQISPQRDNLGIVTAVFEDDSCINPELQRRQIGRIQVFVSRTENEAKVLLEEARSEIAAHVLVLGDGHYRIQFRGFQGLHSTDNVHVDDFEAVFIKRLSNLQRIHNQAITVELALTHISHTQKILETIRPRFPLQTSGSRGRLRGPMSPVKALTNFLGGSLRDPSTSAKQRSTVGDLFSHEDQGSVNPQPSLSRANSGAENNEDSQKSKVTVVQTPEAAVTGSLSQLETTLNTYIVALHARCGNVVGRVIRNRGVADELRVNELYNTLIEDPSQLQAAAEVPVDVLFAAFEKFLNRAWRDRMGPIVSASMLRRIQSIFDTMPRTKIADSFKGCLDQMSPQNRRSFSAMIRLLYDLLEASGNDGDRGALTAAFAEALVIEGSPHSYIPLLDRLTDPNDIDVLFEDGTLVEITTAGLPSGSLQRARSVNTGSVSSTGSSLRKRFGMGILTRENSKSESESKVVQVWRTLSKKSSGEGDSQPPSLSKSFLARTRSTDHDVRKPLPPRPGSQDRPISSSSNPFESRSRPGSAHNAVSSLLSIGENQSAAPAPPRKKRRSSLSDLQDLHNTVTSFGSPSARPIHYPDASVAPFQAARQALRTPSPSKMQRAPEDRKTRLASPSRKENIAPKLAPDEDRAGSEDRFAPSNAQHSPSKRNHPAPGPDTGSLIYGLRERSSPSNIPTLSPRKGNVSPQKMRIQSPKKLRERLDKEKENMGDARPGLQEELARIGDELSALNFSRDGPGSIKGLASRLKSLEDKVSSTMGALSERTSQIQRDLESSLVVSEKKNKGLDELYRESNAENELLYDRFNSELEKVLSKIRRGDGIAAIQAKLEEAQNDAARLRKENQRLKRENLGLRSQLTSE